MKKFIPVIFLVLLVSVVIIFSIPRLRAIILNPFIRSSRQLSFNTDSDGTTPVPDTGAGDQNRSKVFSEPGIERIKSDLIGKRIPGWSFDRITEFRKAVITSIARTDTRIDFRIDLQMLSYTPGDETLYDAQVIVTYIAGDEDWEPGNPEEVYLSFEITIPAGRWFTINSIPGCSMQPDIKNKLEWTSKTWDYDIITGPGTDEITLPVASSYDVKARGSHPVKIRLTFRPAE